MKKTYWDSSPGLSWAMAIQMWFYSWKINKFLATWGWWFKASFHRTQNTVISGPSTTVSSAIRANLMRQRSWASCINRCGGNIRFWNPGIRRTRRSWWRSIMFHGTRKFVDVQLPWEPIIRIKMWPLPNVCPHVQSCRDTHSFKNTQYNTRYRFAITFCYYSPV